MIPGWLCSSTERLFRSRQAMGIVTISPVQLAWCRVLDGQPLGELWDDALVRASFNNAKPPEGPISEFVCFGGIRGGKTALIAATAIKCSQTVNTAPLMRGENFRIPIVSTKMDLAAQTFHHLRNAIQESSILRTLLVRKPKDESLELWHPSGHICEIVVTAGARAGGSVAARYLGAAIFDEFPRMLGSEDGVVNWDDMRGECKGRILDGGIVLNAGSPWAPYGPAYEIFVERFGKPSSAMVVARAKAQWLNPSWWTDARVEDYKSAPGGLDRAITNIEAEFAAQEEALFAPIELERATRQDPAPLAFQPGASYVAAMDPATRGNGWTLSVFTREGPKIRQVLARQWVGSQAVPLRPREVLSEVAEILRGYQTHVVYTDQYHFDTLRDLAEEMKLALVQINMTERERTERYQGFYLRVAEGLIELCPDAWQRADLQRIRKRVSQSGVSIILPKTSDGRHCDFAPVDVLATRPFIDDVVPELPKRGTDAALAAEEKRIEAALRREARRKKREAHGYG